MPLKLERSFEVPPIEDRDARDKEITDAVAAASSFDEVYAAIRRAGEIQSTSGGALGAERVIKRIERVRHGYAIIEHVPRTHLIRDKVEELLPGDEVHNKYVVRGR